MMHRNAVWNISGAVLPTLVGLLAIPLLLQRMGTEQFGMLSLCWALVGVLGLLDMGMGRSLTQKLAVSGINGVPDAEVGGLAVAGMVGIAALGLVFGVLLFVCSDRLAGYILPSNPLVAAEFTVGLRWLSASVPLAIVSSAFIGILEGRQRFAIVNSIRVCLGSAMFLVPLAASYASTELSLIIGSLFAVRLIAFTVYMLAAAWALPSMLRPAWPSRKEISDIYRFSGWLAFSNIIGPAMSYLDKLIISRVLGAHALTVYSLPADILARVTVLPFAIMNSLLPAIAQIQAARTEGIADIVGGVNKTLLLFWMLPLLVGCLVAEDLLRWWVGAELAGQSLPVVGYFFIGAFVNGLAILPYTLLHGEGKMALTAFFHLIEFFVFVVLLIIGVRLWGIQGAAIAWMLRICLDAILLYASTIRRYTAIASELKKSAALACIGSLLLLVCTRILSVELRLGVAALIALLFVVMFFVWIRDNGSRVET